MAKVAAEKKKEKSAPRHNPGAFLDLPASASAYGTAKVVVLPLPLEESVSYGGGTAKGPAAIIEASRQVELYDPRLDCEPAMEYGIHTLPVPEYFSSPGADARRKLDFVALDVERHLSAGKFLVGLGGEHTVSLGVAKGVAEACGDFTLVHVDAHADLRDSYEGNPLSHACVVRRIAEIPQCREILQLGIRSTSRDQAEYVRAHGKGGERPRIRAWYAWDMHAGGEWRKEFGKAVRGRTVFFTFDVDGLDPAVVPATGTPEPDGLSWRQFMDVAAIVAKHAKACPAMDCVELAPAPGLHCAEFAVARALYMMITMLRGTGG